MSKKFNITGLCIPERDYMADISGKLDTIICCTSDAFLAFCLRVPAPPGIAFSFLFLYNENVSHKTYRT